MNNFQTVWKFLDSFGSLHQCEKFPDSLASFRTVWKVKSLYISFHCFFEDYSLSQNIEYWYILDGANYWWLSILVLGSKTTGCSPSGLSLGSVRKSSDVNARLKGAVADDHTDMDVRQFFKRRPVVSEEMSSRNKTVNIWVSSINILHSCKKAQTLSVLFFMLLC